MAALFLLLLLHVSDAAINPGDLSVLHDLRRSLTNADAVLGWGDPNAADPCAAWPHISCDRAGRVNNIDLKNAGLAGTLPSTFAALDALQDLSLQNNNLSGDLPSFRGMASLRHAFLNNNSFRSIPADFFSGLTSLLVISLDQNPLNVSSGGWTIPADVAAAQQLQSLSLNGCNLTGAIPDFLGAMNSLQELKLAYNALSGPIPSTFNASGLQTLWLNNQHGVPKLSGTLDLIATMPNLEQAWLHGNDFSGPIPDSIADCKRLSDLCLNSNQLVGLVPPALESMAGLKSVQLDNNNLLGPVPAIKAPKYTYSQNGFCADKPGVACSPQVMALLHFLAEVDYPKRLVASWSGNNSCVDWLGISCVAGNVTMLNLPEYGLNGTISDSLGNLSELSDINLIGNNLTGHVPDSLTSLRLLQKLDLSGNDLTGPLPTFSPSVKVNVTGNLNFNGTAPGSAPSKDTPGSSSSRAPTLPGQGVLPENKKKRSAVVLATTIPVAVSVVALASVCAVLIFRKKRGSVPPNAASVVVHPRENSDPDNLVKIVMVNNDGNSSSTQGNTLSGSSSRASDVHMIDTGNFVIAVQVLRGATKNFTQDNVLGRGGFGVVYKGELHDGTMIAVKRMEAAVISNKALDEFQAEITILTKVRHRNLVSILGYSIEGNERLLVYEYMSNGALSKHLFQWKQFELEPLSWKKRLNIALDVARGMEYLHNLAHQCYIHRDLKSANILLGDDFRAKVSDFGLVKHAPDGNFSVATRLAGTFGYLAPEYAGKNRFLWKYMVVVLIWMLKLY
jgi:Leucine-rich repeat (LRR) protein